VPVPLTGSVALASEPGVAVVPSEGGAAVELPADSVAILLAQ
jgi:hypothetical protein